MHLFIIKVSNMLQHRHYPQKRELKKVRKFTAA